MVYVWFVLRVSHASFFSFHFLSFSISFPQTNYFYYFWKITAVSWEILSWRLVEKLHISAFPMYYSLCNWIEEHEITKLKENIFGSNPEKGHKNKHKKTRRKWDDTKWTIWCFPQCACVNAIYFAPVVTTTYRMKNNKSSTRGLCLEMSVFDRARVQMLNMLYISTHQSVPPTSFPGSFILRLVQAGHVPLKKWEVTKKLREGEVSK